MRLAIAGAILVSILITPVSGMEISYRDAALEASRWITASAIKTNHGSSFLADPGDPTSNNDTLYSGTPGVILFFIEAYRATSDRSQLNSACAGADHLLDIYRGENESGLYVGIAGIGFALTETFKVTGDPKYLEGAAGCAKLLGERAKRVGRGIEWNETTDIIAGGAGIGLFLLYAARELKDQTLIDLAVRDAYRLIELAQSEKNGLKWKMNPGFARLMPNFSHGTAGIAYFLATLYKRTNKKEFLDAALAGARYLQSIAHTDGDSCLIFHNEPEGKDLYYLGWCHGPVGTARLFYRLYNVTGDRMWMDWVKKSARGVMQSGIPEKQTPGFWNNVSQCCGSAGVAEFFLSLYRVTRDATYLDFSKRVTAQLLAKVTRDGNGARWIQAEHRVKPELLIAQTGYMQGASGIGMLLFHLDGLQRGKKPSITFPDSPF